MRWMSGGAAIVAMALAASLADASPPPPPSPPPVLAARAPRALSAQGLINLHAFARLYGVVRFFHPSDEAAAADWNVVAIAGVLRVEAARNPDELAAALKAVFTPLAPTLQIYRVSAPTPAPRPTGAEPGEWIAWRHQGVELAPNTVYHSARGVVPQLRPGDATVIDLGGGLRARAPLTLPRVAGRTTPGASADDPIALPSNFTPSGDDRATRLADVVIVWNVMQDFYPYFDVVKDDWPAQLDRALKSAATDHDDDAFTETLERMMVSLDDGHGVVRHKPVTAVLPLRWRWIEGRMIVVATAPSAGEVKVGDEITSFYGRPITQVMQTREALTPGSTERLRLVKAADDLVVSGGKSAVELTGRHADGRTFKLRMAYSLPVADYVKLPMPPAIEDVAPGVVYVNLLTLDEAALEKALPRLATARAIIADVRGHPTAAATAFLQHVSSTSLHSSHFNIPVLIRPDRVGMTFEAAGDWTLEPLTPHFSGKVVFLTDENAYSYGETVMEIVESYRLGPIVGGATAGVNGNINPFRIPGGYAIQWTGLQTLKRDGSRLQGVGIVPTVPVKVTVTDVRAGRDAVLEAAIKVAGAP